MLINVAFPAALLLVLAFTAVRPVGDPDVWFHMAFGRHVLEEGTLPRGDIFSYTVPGREWISSGWASSVFLELLFRAGGPGALAWVVWAVLAASYLAVYFLAVRLYANRGSIAVLLLAGILTAYLRFSPRPDLFSQLGVAATVGLLMAADARMGQQSAGQRPSWFLWLLPIVFLLWGNLHVGFIAGLEIVAIYTGWQGWQWWRTRNRAHLMALAPCALCFFIWMLNPYGPDLVSLVAKNREIPQENERNFEWMPLVFWPRGHFSWEGIRAFSLPWDVYLGVAVLWSLAALAVLRRKRAVPAWHYAVLALFVAHAVYQRRQLGLAALVLPAMVAPHLGWVETLLWRRRGSLAATVLVGAIAICLMRAAGFLAMPGGLPATGVDQYMLPVRATEFLRQQNPPDNIYNTYYLGGYLLYQLAPDRKVFYDGRLDVYGPGIWNEYWALEEGRIPLEELAQKYGIRTFVVDTREAGGNPRHLAARLSGAPGWKPVYFDDNYMIFVRSGPGTQDFIAKHSLEWANPLAPEKMAAALKHDSGAGEVRKQVERAVEVSGGSGNAHAVAALAALESGDRATAGKHLQAARARGVEISF